MAGSKEVKIGIIGFGEMGKRHALEYHEATQGWMKFTAVVEPEENNYESGCEWYGQRPAHYTSVKEMLAKEELDGLIIASPNALHKDNLADCIESGLPVMIEKPLDVSLEKISEVVRIADQYPAPIMVNHVMRFSPIIQKAKALINAGEIGRVCSFNFIQYSGGGALFSTFRRTMKGGGGQLVEKATHDLDVAFYLCGAGPRGVSAICRRQKYGGDKSNKLTCSACDDYTCPSRVTKGSNTGVGVKDISLSHDLCVYAKEVDVSDNEMCLIDCDNGVFGTYAHCYFALNHYSRRYEIIGTEGLLSIELTLPDKQAGCNGRIVLARNHYLKSKREEYKFEYFGRIHYNGGPFTGQHFHQLIQGRTKPFTTVEDAFAAEMLGIGAMRASELGRRVDLESEVVPEDLQPAFRSAYSDPSAKPFNA